VSYFIVAAVLTATMYGADPTIAHKVDVKDRNGVSVLTISDIKMSRRSALVLQGVVRNVSGADLTVDTVVGTVHKKDGSTVEFSFGICDFLWCEISKDSVRTLLHPFPKPWPFAATDVVSVEFSLPTSWLSPEDNRIAAGQANRNAAEAERKRLAIGVVVYDDDIIPKTASGNIVIQHPQFIFKDQFNIYEPLLTFRIVDKSSVPWESVPLQFDMGGVCNGELRHWSASIDLRHSTLVFMEERGMKNYDYRMDSLNGKVQGCRTEVIKVRVGEPPIEPLDLRAEVEARKVKRESEEAAKNAAEDAAKVERDRFAAELAAQEEEARTKRAAEREKQEAADAARRKRLAAEQKKKDDELNARLARERAEEEARASEERRKIRDACGLIYKNTADKKVSDLTVKEEQQVRRVRRWIYTRQDDNQTNIVAPNNHCRPSERLSSSRHYPHTCRRRLVPGGWRRSGPKRRKYGMP
jgi:hypothetical protein